MIPISRASEQPPSVLSRKAKGKTELVKATDAFAKFVEMRQGLLDAADDPDEVAIPRFKFNFARYRELEVRQRLEAMFHGKCAYCEQRYGALHPMDVEHWRPKARVEYGGQHGDRETGYWWLASNWDNLLPSCIDCNRARKQIAIGSTERVMMGKGNQFPLAGTSVSAIDAGHTAVDQEEPLLLNPCEEGFDPAKQFSYTNGIMVGLTDRADASIRVYALNRPELVHEREAMVRIFDHRVKVLTDIAKLVHRERQSGDEHKLDRDRTMIEQMHDDVRAELFDMADPARPFSGMIKHMLREIARDLRSV